MYEQVLAHLIISIKKFGKTVCNSSLN